MLAIKKNLPKGNNPYMLLCFDCFSEYSASYDDYFYLPNTHIFTCCNEIMSIVKKETIYKDMPSMSSKRLSGIGKKAIFLYKKHLQRTLEKKINTIMMTKIAEIKKSKELSAN